MEFRQCSIMGNKYAEKNGMLMRALDDSVLHLQQIEHFTVCLLHLYLNKKISNKLNNLKSEEEQFLITLALCHTVTISGHHKNQKTLDRDFLKAPAGLEYQASSPDEKALTEACRK